MSKEIRTTMRVNTIQEVRTHTKNTDKQLFALKGKDSDGAGTVLIKLPNSFDGFKPDALVDIIISTSQTSLSDFEGEKEPSDPLSKKKKGAK